MIDEQTRPAGDEESHGTWAQPADTADTFEVSPGTAAPAVPMMQESGITRAQPVGIESAPEPRGLGIGAGLPLVYPAHTRHRGPTTSASDAVARKLGDPPLSVSETPRTGREGLPKLARKNHRAARIALLVCGAVSVLSLCGVVLLISLLV